MKTYIVNSLKDAIRLNKKLDSISNLQNKEWTVFSEDKNITEKFIFLKKGNLINSINGLSSYYNWQYITINSSIIIKDEKSKLLFKVAFCDKKLLILNLDGTQEYCFLINTGEESNNKLLSYEDIQWYLFRKYDIDILSDKQRLEYEQEKRIKAEEYRLEMEKTKEEDKKALIINYSVIVGFLLLFFLFLIMINQ